MQVKKPHPMREEDATNDESSLPAMPLLSCEAERPGLTLVSVLLVALCAVSVVFLAFPVLDRAVSGIFYVDGAGFAMTADPALQLLRNLGMLATTAVIVTAILALAAPFCVTWRLIDLKPHAALYLLAVYAIGPALIVNAFFKNGFGRARPRDILEFGGDAGFTNVWTVAGGCVSNCSFTSGEASAAAAILALIFVVPRAWRLAIGLLLTLFAMEVSISRIAFGGHFLSDTLLSWIVVLLVAVLLRPLFLGPRGARIDRTVARIAQRFGLTASVRQAAFAEASQCDKRAPMNDSSSFDGPAPQVPTRSASANASAPTIPRAPYALLSVVIPARNESQNLAILVLEIAEALAHRDHEIIVVDDGSTDGTATTLADLKAKGRNVRHIRHDRSCGQSRAVRSGMMAAHGDLVVTIDGDGQNDPAFIPDLVAALEAAGTGAGLAAGQRVGRTDTRLKQLSSRFANNLRTAILHDATRDTGCGLKAIPTELFRRLPFFDGWHRYLPALVMREGHSVVHVDVKDRNRRFGQSNYGIFDRGLRGILDLYGVWWLLRRAKKLPVVGEIALGGAVGERTDADHAGTGKSN